MSLSDLEKQVATKYGAGVLARSLAKAEAKCARLAIARANLPAGSTRARVTSANAKWMRAAEQRDRLAEMLAFVGGSHE